MKYSVTSSQALKLYDPETAFRTIRESGFDSMDFGVPCSDYAWGRTTSFDKSDAEFDAYYKEYADAAHAADLKVSQLHAPFPTWPESNDPAEFRHMMNAILRSLRATAIMESPYLVIHCAMRKGWGRDDDPAKTRELNYEVMAELIPEAEKQGVSIALENMPIDYIPTSSPEMLIDYIDMMGSDRLVACLDTGHANISGVDPSDFALKLGSRLKVLHIHDNHAAPGIPITNRSDEHTCPVLGNIDWQRFFGTLKAIGYTGTFSLESDNFTKRTDSVNYPLFEHFEFSVLKDLTERYFR